MRFLREGGCVGYGEGARGVSDGDTAAAVVCWTDPKGRLWGDLGGDEERKEEEKEQERKAGCSKHWWRFIIDNTARNGDNKKIKQILITYLIKDLINVFTEELGKRLFKFVLKIFYNHF